MQLFSGTIEIELDSIEANVSNSITKEIELAIPFIKGNVKEIKLSGNIDGNIESLTIKINGKYINSNEFEIALENLNNIKYQNRIIFY